MQGLSFSNTKKKKKALSVEINKIHELQEPSKILVNFVD